MTCPRCGATVGPSDAFCMECGRPLRPAGSTQPLGATTQSLDAQQSAAPSPQPLVALDEAPRRPVTTPGGLFGSPVLPDSGYDSPFDPDTGQARRPWASASSFPTNNPYPAPPPSPPVVFTPRPRRRVQRSGGNNVGAGIGGIIVAIMLSLKALGGTIAGIGFFKLYFLLNIFRLLTFGHAWFLIILLVIIIGLVVNSQTA